MATGNLWKTNLYFLNQYAQNSTTLYTTDAIIWALKEFFSQDHYYHYQSDSWGFNKTPDNTGLELTDGLENDVSTRLFIGEYFRQNVQFYPAILVKDGGFRSVPISMSRNKFYVNYENIKYTDGYGESTLITRPVSYEQNGAWEGTMNVEVQARDSFTRSDLIGILALFFTDRYFETFANMGIVIKNVSAGSPSESDDRNEKMFKQTISLDIRTEWSRIIPISKTIDVMNFCIEFGDTYKEPFVPAPNLTIETSIDLLDVWNNF